MITVFCGVQEVPGGGLGQYGILLSDPVFDDIKSHATSMLGCAMPLCRADSCFPVRDLFRHALHVRQSSWRVPVISRLISVMQHPESNGTRGVMAFVASAGVCGSGYRASQPLNRIVKPSPRRLSRTVAGCTAQPVSTDSGSDACQDTRVNSTRGTG